MTKGRSKLMRILLYLTMLPLLAFNAGAEQRTPLKISVISQKRVMGKSDNPFANRSITFEVTNHTKDTIYVHGFNSTFGFFPTGFLSHFDIEKKLWVRPDGEARFPTYEEVENKPTDIYRLRPNESMRFTDLTEEFYVGNKFRRIFFVSTGSKGKAEVITSPEFVLK
jgi:hypothetical protein